MQDLTLPEEIPYPPSIVQMSHDIREFIANRESFEGDEQLYESRLKALRDREWRFSSAYKTGYQQGFLIGCIQGLQSALGLDEADTDLLSELSMEELAAIFRKLRLNRNRGNG